MGAYAAPFPALRQDLSSVSRGSIAAEAAEATGLSVEEYFVQALDWEIYREEVETGFPQDQWFPSGPKGAHGRDWWAANGPRMVRNFTDWYEANDDVSVWTAPDGRPAIELGLTVNFGAVPVKMYLDLVLQMGTALVVVDLKSGARTPDSMSQLAIYACGLELAYGKQYRPRYGTFFMLRGVGRAEDDKTYFLTPTELDAYQYSVPFWTRQFTLFDRGVTEGVFVAKPSEACKRCGVSYACPAVGGRWASSFDKSIIEDLTPGQVVVLDREVQIRAQRAIAPVVTGCGFPISERGVYVLPVQVPEKPGRSRSVYQGADVPSPRGGLAGAVAGTAGPAVVADRGIGLVLGQERGTELRHRSRKSD